VNRPVDSTATAHLVVRGVDDGVHGNRGDVSEDDVNGRHGLILHDASRGAGLTRSEDATEPTRLKGHTDEQIDGAGAGVEHDHGHGEGGYKRALAEPEDRDEEDVRLCDTK
jgi:hypothetical protein